MFVLPTRRLTVVQLLPALCSGGVERSTLEVAAALVQAGHRAIVVSAGGPLVAFLLSIGAEHITLDIGRKSLLTLRHIAALRRLFAQLRPDIVHARSRLPAWLTWYALHGSFLFPKAAIRHYGSWSQCAEPIQCRYDLWGEGDLCFKRCA